MPSTSKKQHNFMAAVANNPKFAKKAGVPQSVGKDFADADKGKKFGKGDSTRADVQSVNQPKTNHGSMALFKQGGDTMASKMNAGFMAMIAKKKAGAKSEMPSKMGKPVMKKGMDVAKDGMKMAKGGMAYAKGGGIESKGKTKGKIITMKMGGKAC
jgi:hypothetical protein